MKTDDIKDPQHYAGKYPFEVFQAIELLLNTFAKDLPPYQIYQLGNEIKYRLRAGWKEDGEGGAKDIRKAIRCNEMRGEAVGRSEVQSGVGELEQKVRRACDAALNRIDADMRAHRKLYEAEAFEKEYMPDFRPEVTE